MAKITVTVECADEMEAVDVTQRLAGLGGADVVVVEKPEPPKKKATPTEKAKEATREENDPPAKPAKVKKSPPKKKEKALTKEDVKAEIIKHAGDPTDPEVSERIKDYVKSFGAVSLSKLEEDQYKDVFDGAEEFFAQFEEEAEEDEDDPMA